MALLDTIGCGMWSLTPYDLTSHDTWNYFWNRRPATAVRKHAS